MSEHRQAFTSWDLVAFVCAGLFGLMLNTAVLWASRKWWLRRTSDDLSRATRFDPMSLQNLVSWYPGARRALLACYNLGFIPAIGLAATFGALVILNDTFVFALAAAISLIGTWTAAALVAKMAGLPRQ